MNHPAIVLNCHYNGLSIIRDLGRRGVKVYALDARKSVGTVSRFANFRLCPNPLVSNDEFIDFLLKIGPEFESRPVLIPTMDQWAMSISHAREKLEQFYIPCVADRDAIDKCIYKQQFYRWALEKGYPVPRSWKAADWEQIPDDAFPVAAKPEFRVSATNHSEAFQRSLKYTEERLEPLFSAIDVEAFVARHKDNLSDFLIQEYVRGMSDHMITIGIYADRNHRVRGIFTGRKIRGYPPDVGDCMAGESYEVPEQLIDITQSICAEIGYHGIAEFEFKQDSETGDFKLLEINPRTWSWVGITPACGISLGWMAYRDLTGMGLPDVCLRSHAKTGEVKWVRIAEDPLNCVYFNKKAGFPQWHHTWRSWWHSLKARKLVVAEFAKDDFLPGIWSLRQKIREIRKNAVTRSSKTDRP
jgi:predicted ATP-grasp superfamily ATP-dependent carboligase